MALGSLRLRISLLSHVFGYGLLVVSRLDVCYVIGFHTLQLEARCVHCISAIDGKGGRMQQEDEQACSCSWPR